MHEPIREWLVGGTLNENQTSMTSSRLGACSIFSNVARDSGSKVGFSWVSPTDLIYMVERPNDFKYISRVSKIIFPLILLS